jgi:hypothetical protein
MICLTGDVHHSSLGTNDQRYLSGDTEVLIAARYVQLAEAHGLKLTLYVTGKTFAGEWRDFQPVAAARLVEIGGHTYSGIPLPWWKKAWYRWRGLTPPSHSGTHGLRDVQRRDICQCLAAIKGFLHRPVLAWRSHGLVHDAHTYPLLAEAGIRLISDEISATKTRPEPTTAGLLSHPINVLPDHDHLLHAHRDQAFVAQAKRRGYGADAFGCESYPIKQWGDLVQQQVEAIESQGGVATVLMHPICQFLADGFRTAEKLFAFFARYRTVWASELLAEAGTIRGQGD